MIKQEKYPKWLFIVFPAIAMLLGWGLRGYIGGGPFGAMIPGAMVAMTISILLELPPGIASIFVLFGVVGVGIGGEMTYGQTLGFLKNSDTIWWGTLGTTVKGSIWGLLGGIILSMGLLYNRLSKKTIIIGFLVLLIGMLIGFKLINQPMVIYFSDPAKPRAESWAALLFGAIALLLFLKNKMDFVDFSIISRFALCGLIGGGLGFGLGGFWMVLGFQLPTDVIFQEYWKAMEFTFGLLLGSAFGYAAWLCRNELDSEKAIPTAKDNYAVNPILKELAVTFIIGLLIFWFFSFLFDPIVEAGKGIRGFTMVGFRDLAILLSNYTFFGLIMIVTVMRFPKVAWQLAITLTFCHTLIDLFSDIYPDAAANSPFTALFALVFIITFIVASLTAFYQRSKYKLHNLFLILVWSTVLVAFLRFAINTKIPNISELSISELLFRIFFVHIVFMMSALFVSWISYKNKTVT